MKFKKVPLTDITKVTTGKSNRQDAVSNGKYIFFDRSQDVKRSNRYLFDDQAIIVPGEGKSFEPRYFCGKFDLHQRVYALFPKSVVDGRYLYYAVKNEKKHFERVAVGSTVKSLRLASFETMMVPFPDLDIQVKIASLLNSIDAKIELNNQLNDYLAA